MVITPLRKQTTPITRIMPATNTTQMPTPMARRCPTITRIPPWTKTTTFMVTANTPDTAPQCFGNASGGR
ncbi:hypothetical protein GCM10009585_07790 [Brevibacterium paucivorans]